jgi:hypothetical protein
VELVVIFLEKLEFKYFITETEKVITMVWTCNKMDRIRITRRVLGLKCMGKRPMGDKEQGS